MINLKYIWDTIIMIAVVLFMSVFLIWACTYPAYYFDCRAAKNNSELLEKIGYTTIVQDTTCMAYTKSGWMGCKVILMSIGQ